MTHAMYTRLWSVSYTRVADKALAMHACMHAGYSPQTVVANGLDYIEFRVNSTTENGKRYRSRTNPLRREYISKYCHFMTYS